MSDDQLRIIVGLGNPGEDRKYNRHNVGHLFVDHLSNYELKITDYEFKLLKTDCFMNDSGSFVAKQIRNSKFVIDNLIIIHDDLDIPLGKFKIHFGKGPLIHYGVNSIEEALGSKEFWRVRVGVDNRDPDNRMPGDKYVLENFTNEELEVLNNLFPKIWEELRAVLKVNSH